MTWPWELVPVGHRARNYEYSGKLVRCKCACGWTSTLAQTLEDARRLWDIHIRSLVRAPR